jgi:hypothetical protein
MRPVLRRQWGAEESSARFPAWRIWEDTRVRADNNVMALFVAARIARTSIHERAGHLDRPLVGDLYNDDELRYRAGFRLTLMEVASRFDAVWKNFHGWRSSSQSPVLMSCSGSSSTA